MYELTWKGYSDTTFHRVEDLKDCWKLVMEFEESSEEVSDTNIVGAVVEYKYDDWKEKDREAAKAAKEREEDAMFKPNFSNDNARL